ncbi:peptidoglycan-binding domain-containing protein [Actinophytocola sp.]|uniref:peptidoglycan-binding domain-containing protein n=1 Tax=Actinophytocola sp. TaxID=1872138 RepID=UPI002ED639C0
MTGPHVPRRRRRVRWLVTGVSVLAVLGVGTAVAVTRLASRPIAAAEAPSAPDTVAVRKMDLAERETITGELGYGAEQPLNGRRPGTITALPAQDAVLDRGSVIYQADAKPVVLFLGSLPLYRTVSTGMTDGPDVKVVEENLRDLGYRGFGTPDDEFTAATATAIKKWQKKLGIDQTGVIELGDVVVTPAAVRVSTVKAALGDDAGGEVLEYTGTTRVVTADLEEGQKDLAAAGTKVTLTIGGKQVPGTVTSVAPAVPSDSADPNAEPGFTAAVSIDGAIDAVDSGSVDVEFTSAARQGVLAVPVGALLALAEGGYAVELASGKLVAVTTGLFADGMVEVSGEGLTEGAKVVTTS